MIREYILKNLNIVNSRGRGIGQKGRVADYFKH